MPLASMSTAMSDWVQPLRCMLWSRCKPLQVVKWLGLQAALDEDTQAAVLDVLSTDEMLTVAPLEPAYRHSLFKFMVDAAERQHHDLCEELVEAYSASLQQQSSQQAHQCGSQWFIKTFCFAQGDHIGSDSYMSMVQHHSHHVAQHLASSPAAAPSTDPILPSSSPAMSACQTPGATNGSSQHSDCLQPGNPGVRPPTSPCLISLRVSSNMLAGGTGCAEWEAGLVLAETLLNQPELVQGKTCVELGCGAGAVGVAAARAGAARLVLTDGDAVSAHNCLWNCQLNGIPAQPWQHSLPPLQTPPSTHVTQPPPGPHPQVVECGVLEWDGALSRWPTDLQPQVVLGSDLLYDPVVIPHLVSLFQGLCAHPQQPAVVYLSTTRRNEATLDLFLHHVSAAGLALQDVTEQLQLQGAARFQQQSWLDEARHRVLIHRITAGGHV